MSNLEYLRPRVLAALILLSPGAFAYDAELILPPREYPLLECFSVAARTYQIPSEYLWAIGKVESNFRSVVGPKNKNGTVDIGVMQINTTHLPHLKKFGINRSRLLDEPCLNIHVGAWVLRGNINRYGHTWEAIGAYNASKRRPDLRLKYARKVREKIAWLIDWRNANTRTVHTEAPHDGRTTHADQRT